MTEQLPGPSSGRAVERGETYQHGEHGHVEVTGIWHQTRCLDMVHESDADELIVLRFVTGEDGEWID